MTQNSNETFELNIRDLIERIWRARRKIVLFQLVAMLGTIFVILFWPRSYSSEAKIFLQRGHESVRIDPTATTGKTVALQQASRDAEIKSAIDVLMSRGIIEATVDDLTPDVVLGGVAVGEGKSTLIGDTIKTVIGSAVNMVRSIDPASDRERAVVAIEKGLVVDAERKSEIISVIYEADTPELAQTIVANLVKQYKTKHAELHRTSGSTEFFDQQSQRLRVELETASNELRDAKNNLGVASIVDQRVIMESRLGNIRQALMDNKKELNSGVAMGRSLSSQLNARPERRERAETTKRNTPEDLQAQSYYNLTLRLAEAESMLKSSHPKVKSLKAQVFTARQELAQQRTKQIEKVDDINPIHEKLTFDYTENIAKLAGLSAGRNELQSQERELLASIRDLNKHSITIAQLEREVEVANKKYMTCLLYTSPSPRDS